MPIDFDDATLKQLFDAADAHGAATNDTDYACGDLQEMLTVAWRLLSPSHKQAFMQKLATTSGLSDCPEYAEIFKPLDGPRTYEIWAEGYQATGDRGTASFCGRIFAQSFTDAVRAWYKDKNDPHGNFDAEKLTYWGCRHFETEAEARKSFG